MSTDFIRNLFAVTIITILTASPLRLMSKDLSKDSTLLFFIYQSDDPSKTDYTNQNSQIYKSLTKLAQNLAPYSKKTMIKALEWTPKYQTSTQTVSFNSLARNGKKIANQMQTLITQHRKKYGLTPNIIGYGYDESASVLSYASRQKQCPPIDLMIVSDPPVYESISQNQRDGGYLMKQLIPIRQGDFKPHADKVYNFYSKHRYRPCYTQRKFSLPVINVLCLAIDKKGVLENLLSSDMQSPLFLDAIPELINSTRAYTLHTDLVTIALDKKNSSTRKKHTLINRFADTSDTSKHDFTQKVSKTKIMQYTFELYESLKNYNQIKRFLTPPSSWLDPAGYITSDLHTSLERIKKEHTNLKHNNNHPLKYIDTKPLFLTKKERTNIENYYKKPHWQDSLVRVSKKLPDMSVKLSYAKQQIADGKIILNKITTLSDKKYSTWKQSIMTSQNSRLEYLIKIIALMWYFFYQAIEQKNGHLDGSFTIFGPHTRRIYDFLFSYQKHFGAVSSWTWGLTSLNRVAYVRINSHLGGNDLMNGIDIRLDKNGYTQPMLPNKMRHILYCLKTCTVGEFLFIKMEKNGTSFGYDLAEHFFDLLKSQVKTLRCDYEKNKDKEWFNKERVPKALIREFRNLLTFIKHKIKNKQEYKELLSLYTQRTARTIASSIHGIWLMHKSAVSLAQSKGLSEQEQALFKKFYRDLEKTYDNIDKRIGREVILVF